MMESKAIYCIATASFVILGAHAEVVPATRQVASERVVAQTEAQLGDDVEEDPATRLARSERLLAQTEAQFREGKVSYVELVAARAVVKSLKESGGEIKEDSGAHMLGELIGQSILGIATGEAAEGLAVELNPGFKPGGFSRQKPASQEAFERERAAEFKTYEAASDRGNNVIMDKVLHRVLEWKNSLASKPLIIEDWLVEVIKIESTSKIVCVSDGINTNMIKFYVNLAQPDEDLTANLSKGQKVLISGSGVKEYSITTKGAMDNPEIVVTNATIKVKP